jgi:hypothetical protein
MSEYNEYGDGGIYDDDAGDYGGDYGDYNDDGGDGDGYEYPDEQQYVFGYRQLEQIGGPDDDELALGLRTEIEGGTLRQKQQQMDLIAMSPIEQFKLSVRTLLTENTLNLSEADKTKIKTTIKNIPLIKYKSAEAYVLGYFLHLFLPPQEGTARGSGRAESLTRALTVITKYVRNTNLTPVEIVKYARYWQQQT